MPHCPFPIRIKNLKPSFTNPEPYLDVPCGKCSVCEYNRKQDWILRCIHESRNNHFTFFVTLTYNDDNLPLCPECGKPYICKYDSMDFVNSCKKFFSFFGLTFRYFLVGEYGETSGRPHFHLLAFLNEDGVSDISKTSFDEKFFVKSFETIWKYGFVYCGGASDGAAAYCAKYCLKNIPYEHDRCHHVNGYLSCSRKPIIGYSFVEKRGDYLLEHPEILSLGINQYKYRIPRAYSKKLIENDPIYRFSSSYFKRKFTNEKSRENSYGVDRNGMPLSDGGYGQRLETVRNYRRRMHKRGTDKQ